MVTLNRDGSPQVTCVWVTLDDGEIVSAHLGRYQKIRNIERDPRVAISIEGEELSERGLRRYLVVRVPLGSRRAARPSSCSNSPTRTSGRTRNTHRWTTLRPAT